jgi:hypothetical protein
MWAILVLVLGLRRQLMHQVPTGVIGSNSEGDGVRGERG